MSRSSADTIPRPRSGHLYLGHPANWGRVDTDLRKGSSIVDLHKLHHLTAWSLEEGQAYTKGTKIGGSELDGDLHAGGADECESGFNVRGLQGEVEDDIAGRIV